MSNPYDSMSTPQPAPTGGGGMKIVLVILAVIVGLGAFSCLCCGGLSYFGFQKGMEEVGRQITDRVNDHPVVQEQLGGIEQSKLNLMASGEEQQRSGEQVMVLDVSGPKGSGQILARQVGGDFNWIKLRTDEGEWVVYGDEDADTAVDEVMEFDDAPQEESLAPAP